MFPHIFVCFGLASSIELPHSSSDYTFSSECVSYIKDGIVHIKHNCVEEQYVENVIEMAKNASNASFLPTYWYDFYKVECFGGVVDGQILIDHICNSQLISDTFSRIQKVQEPKTHLHAFISGLNLTKVKQEIRMRHFFTVESFTKDEAGVDRKLSFFRGGYGIPVADPRRRRTPPPNRRRRLRTAQQMWAAWLAQINQNMYDFCVLRNNAVRRTMNPWSICVSNVDDECGQSLLACGPPTVWDPNCAGHDAVLSFYLGCAGSSCGSGCRTLGPLNFGSWNNAPSGAGTYAVIYNWGCRRLGEERNLSFNGGGSCNAASSTKYIGPCGESTSKTTAFCHDSVPFASGRRLLVQKGEDETRRLGQRKCR